jgi:DNA-binding CsgD family transcriptional regulator
MIDARAPFERKRTDLNAGTWTTRRAEQAAGRAEGRLMSEGSGSMVATDSVQPILNAILEIGETFAATLRLEAVLDIVIESGMRLAGGDSGSVMLLSDDGRELVVTAAVGPRAQIILGTRQAASASIAGQAIQSNSNMVVRGVAGREGGIKSDHPRDLGWGLVMPLRVASRLLGVLNLSTSVHRDELPAERISLLGILANQAAIMIEVGRLYQDLALKERRLELFVDRFLRLQSEQRQQSPNPGRQAPVNDVLRSTVAEYSRTLRSSPEVMPDDPAERLSARELEVLALIVEGLTNKEIASRLCLSPDTVKNHVVHIIQKLGVSDRTQAAVMAVRQGMIA